jgi:predicted PolB exonuclease-like 3'-5' exonuclease
MRGLFFDIETIPHENAKYFIPRATAPSNYKDPEKIARFEEAKTAETLEKAALDPDFARIVAIGYVLHVGESEDIKPVDIQVLTAVSPKNERTVLREFFAEADNANTLIGWNIMEFDLPMMLRRAFALRVRPSRWSIYTPRKYTYDPVLDLYGWFHQWKIGKGLKFVAERYGLEVLAPDMDGSMVSDMTEKELRLYTKSDVWLNVQMYNRMNQIYIPEVR